MFHVGRKNQAKILMEFQMETDHSNLLFVKHLMKQNGMSGKHRALVALQRGSVSKLELTHVYYSVVRQQQTVREYARNRLCW